MINVDVRIRNVAAWIVILEEIILLIQPLAVINVKIRLRDRAIWKCTNELVLVQLSFKLLLLQLSRDNDLVLLSSLHCESLVYHLEVL